MPRRPLFSLLRVLLRRLPLLHRRCSVYERVLPPKDPRRIKAIGNKANALRGLDRLDESLALFEAALELGRQVFERDSDDLLVLEGSMAHTLSQLGMHAEAAEVLERVIEAMERSPLFGPSHESTWAFCVGLGLSLVRLGKFSEAVPLLRDSLVAYDGMGLGPEHPQLGIIPQQLGRALLGAGRAAASLPMFQRCIAFHERKFGLHHYLIPESLLFEAEALGQLGRSFDERLSLLNRAVAIRELSIGREKDSKRQAYHLSQALEKCAMCYEEAGRISEAEARWVECAAANTKVRLGSQWFLQGHLRFTVKWPPSIPH